MRRTAKKRAAPRTHSVPRYWHCDGCKASAEGRGMAWPKGWRVYYTTKRAAIRPDVTADQCARCAHARSDHTPLCTMVADVAGTRHGCTCSSFVDKQALLERALELAANRAEITRDPTPEERPVIDLVSELERVRAVYTCWDCGASWSEGGAFAHACEVSP